jgi:uncharacterized metal-binding protein YceD (DUF177 family)
MAINAFYSILEAVVKAILMERSKDISKKLDLRPFLYGRDPQMLWQFDAVDFDTPELVAVVDVDLKLTKDTTGFVVKGTLKGKGKVPCKDCYATLWSDFEGDVLEHYVLESIGKEKDKAHQVELLEEDFYEVVNPLHPFDLWDVVRQCVILMLPAFKACEFTLDDCPNAITQPPQ